MKNTDRCKARRGMSSYVLLIVLIVLPCACDVDDGESIFLSFPIYNELNDSISPEYTEVCNLLLNETDLISEVLYDTTYSVTRGYDVTMILYRSELELPVCIFIAKVDLKNSNLTIGASLPDNGKEFKRQKLTEQARHAEAAGQLVWGGINGDYFNVNDGTPTGIVYKEGEAIKTTHGGSKRPWVAITKTNRAVIGTKTAYDSIKTDFKDAISGSGKIVEKGIAITNGRNEMDPRTCIGISKDSTTVFLLVADGRRKSYSNGLTLTEAGTVLQVLGAYNAINLDGGGSTTFIVRNTSYKSSNLFNVVNFPSDSDGERAVANGLLVMEK